MSVKILKGEYKSMMLEVVCWFYLVVVEVRDVMAIRVSRDLEIRDISV